MDLNHIKTKYSFEGSIKGGGCLDGWEGDAPDVGGLIEPKDPSRLVECDTFLNLEGHGVEVGDVVQIREKMKVLSASNPQAIIQVIIDQYEGEMKEVEKPMMSLEFS